RVSLERHLLEGRAYGPAVDADRPPVGAAVVRERRVRRLEDAARGYADGARHVRGERDAVVHLRDAEAPGRPGRDPERPPGPKEARLRDVGFARALDRVSPVVGEPRVPDDEPSRLVRAADRHGVRALADLEGAELDRRAVLQARVDDAAVD